MIRLRISFSALWILSFLIAQESKPTGFNCDYTSSDNDVTITMSDSHNACIGFVSYRKILISSWYVIHSLYVYPKFRRKGYGSTLIKKTCALLKTLKATRVYIQPGPFELDHDELAFSKKGYQKKMTALITFYKKLGFEPVHSVTSALARFIYFFMKIDEDSRYLMTKRL